MILASILVLTSTLSPPLLAVRAQDPDAGRDAAVTIEYFRPQHAPPSSLQSALQQLYGPAPLTFMTFGPTLIVRGNEGDLKEALGLAQRLDAEWGESDRRGEDSLASFEYRARYVPLTSLHKALEPFSRALTLTSSTGAKSAVSNLGFLEERGLLLMRDSPEVLAEVRSLLERIDVPRPQVQITCYLLEGGIGSEKDPRVPDELTSSLSKLAPFSSFKLLSFGFFRSDVLSPIQIDETMGGGSFELQLHPKAFEPETRSVTFDRCQFHILRAVGESRVGKTFTTSARVALDEYTVLGALGSEPVFVVLRVSLIE